MDDFVGVLCRARMSEREAIQLIVEMYRPLMLKYANLNTGFDDDLYQEFVCCVISCIFKFENHICRKIQGKIWYFSRIQYENGLRGMKQGFN